MSNKIDPNPGIYAVVVKAASALIDTGVNVSRIVSLSQVSFVQNPVEIEPVIRLSFIEVRFAHPLTATVLAYQQIIEELEVIPPEISQTNPLGGVDSFYLASETEYEEIEAAQPTPDSFRIEEVPEPSAPPTTIPTLPPRAGAIAESPPQAEGFSLEDLVILSLVEQDGLTMNLGQTQLIKKVETIARTISSATIEPIIQTDRAAVLNQYQLYTTDIVELSSYARELSLRMSVPSLPEAVLPSLPITASDQQKQEAGLNAKWGNPHYEIQLYIREAGGDWLPVGPESAINLASHPYQQSNLLNFFTRSLAFPIGINGEIGISLQSTDNGTPTETDSIILFGAIVHEITITRATTTQ